MMAPGENRQLPRTPAVSIIVPAHNYGRFLPDALDSVLGQTFEDWECLVVDDGSTDDTAAVVRAYEARDGRIRLLQKAQGGVASARNAGLRACSGRYVQLLDADDRLEKSKLARHVAFLEAHSETAIVYGEVTFFRTEAPSAEMASLGGRLSRSLMARVHGADAALRKLEHYNIMPINAALVRRGVFERLGGFELTSHGCEDWDFWIRAAVFGYRFDFDDGPPVASVRSHGASASRDALRMLGALVAAAKAFPESAAFGELGRLPVAYEMALGVDDAFHGRRWTGFRKIWHAAGGATEGITSIRWRVYALAALLLPLPLSRSVITWPIPERAFEIYRSLRAWVGRAAGRGAGVSS